MPISLIDIVEVNEARNSRKKNNDDHNAPHGNRWKMSGSISKTSLGPAEGSAPNVNTAGNIMTPARTATHVSRAEVTTALLTSGVRSEK